MEQQIFKISKEHQFLINQIFEIENKVREIRETNSIQRNIDRLKTFFESEFSKDGSGFVYHSPKGENYDETRIDCEANISGSSTENLEIVDVIKPIIIYKYKSFDPITSKEVIKPFIVQKAIVIVKSKTSQ
jgi:hypothetical protein